MDEYLKNTIAQLLVHLGDNADCEIGYTEENQAAILFQPAMEHFKIIEGEGFVRDRDNGFVIAFVNGGFALNIPKPENRKVSIGCVWSKSDKAFENYSLSKEVKSWMEIYVNYVR